MKWNNPLLTRMRAATTSISITAPPASASAPAAALFARPGFVDGERAALQILAAEALDSRLGAFRDGHGIALSWAAAPAHPVAGMTNETNNRPDTQARRRYTWPWWVLAAVLLAIVLAVLWMSREIERTRRIRDLNAPAAPASGGATSLAPASRGAACRV